MNLIQIFTISKTIIIKDNLFEVELCFKENVENRVSIYLIETFKLKSNFFGIQILNDNIKCCTDTYGWLAPGELSLYKHAVIFLKSGPLWIFL